MIGRHDSSASRPFSGWDRRTHSRRARTRPEIERLESRRLLTTISEYPLPSASAQPLAMTTGRDGSIWFIEQAANAIGTINPVTGAVSSIAIPTPNAYAYGIAAGPDGKIYFTEESAGKIGILDPGTQSISEISLNGTGVFPYGIAAGPDGNIWFTELGTSQIGALNPGTGALSYFSTPTAHAEPEGISAGPGGNLYWVEFTGNQIGVINAASHAMSEFAVPTHNAEPSAITAGPDGNIYFTEYGAGKIGRFNPSSHAISEWPTPSLASSPSGITPGPDGNIYFTEQGASRIGALDLAAGTISELITPTWGSAPYGIAAGPRGNVWFTEFQTGAIGSVNLQIVPHLVVTTSPPASLSSGASFGMVVTAQYSAGMVAADYNGVVTVGLPSSASGSLGGTLSVTASQGVAAFSGLTLTAPAGNSSLLVTASGADSVTTGPITVTGTGTGSGNGTGSGGQHSSGSLPPVITGQQIVTVGKGKRAHAASIFLHFSAGLDAARARNARNYRLVQYVRRGGVLVARCVSLRVAYDASANTVKLTLLHNPRFVAGGTLMVSASSASGIEDVQGTPLDGLGTGVAGQDAVFTILPYAGGINH
jgi:virginiamycin B lyase